MHAFSSVKVVMVFVVLAKDDSFAPVNAFFSVQFSIVNESMFVVLESVVIVEILFGITTESKTEAVLRV